jgi:hypothetical protein
MKKSNIYLIKVGVKVKDNKYLGMEGVLKCTQRRIQSAITSTD